MKPSRAARKMRTLEILNYGYVPWKKREDQNNGARIERVRVIFSDEDRTRELLKFCYLKDGRHARTHLTIEPEDFVDLFHSAVEADVFPSNVLKRLSKVLKRTK